MLLGCQLLSYLLITVNYRAIAQGRYLATAASDFAFAGVNYLILRKVVKSDSAAGWLGYTIGSTLGSLLGILITKFIYGA